MNPQQNFPLSFLSQNLSVVKNLAKLTKIEVFFSAQLSFINLLLIF